MGGWEVGEWGGERLQSQVHMDGWEGVGGKEGLGVGDATAMGGLPPKGEATSQAGQLRCPERCVV